jgi:penicillin-binding protein-related factor A (putative recombinase)
MKHIIVVLAYEHLDIIKTSFDSLKTANADFFVVENGSVNSDVIKEYFLGEKLMGYIQFEKNARANALNIFVRDYYELLSQYDFVSITDGDLFFYDIKETLKEITSTFENPKCYVCGSSLYNGNNYLNKGSDRVVGIQPYIDHMKSKAGVKPKSTFGRTGGYLLTFTKKSLFLIKDIHFIDTNIFNKANANGGQCFRTTKNVAYHLTWDLYFDGNPYYEYKKKNIVEIWSKSDEDFKYNKII